MPLYVSRHFPSSPCFSDLLLGHGVHLDLLFGCPPGQLAFLPGCTVTPSFSPVLLACPSDPPLHAPSTNTHGVHIACQTREESGGERAHSPAFLLDWLGLAARRSHPPGSCHSCSVGDMGLGCGVALAQEQVSRKSREQACIRNSAGTSSRWS